MSLTERFLYTYEIVLTGTQAKQLLVDHAVALRVVKGTQDYTFFSQVFKVDSLPSIYLIDKGVVRAVFEKEDASLTTHTFADRVALLMGSNSADTNHHSEVTGTAAPEETATEETQNHSPSPEEPSPAAPQLPTQAASDTTDLRPRQSSTPSTHKTPTQSPSRPNPTQSHDASAKQYQETLRKQRIKEREERNRILKLLESDREERRRQAAMRQKTPDSVSSTPTPVDSPRPGFTSQSKNKTNKNLKECALLIRLFDGTPLKHKFRADETLIDVRAWVDESRTDGTHPYSFFQPMCRKTYGDGEESNSLLELDLAPSASLVLKPATGSISSAYEGGAAGGPYELLHKGATTIASALYTFLGIGYTPPSREEPPIARDSEEARMARLAAAAAVQSRTIALTDNENENTGGPSASGTSSVLKSGLSTPRPNLSTVSSSASINRLGMNASASNSSSNLHNIRTIHSSQTPTPMDDDDEERHTYNGNQLSLEDDRDTDDK